MNTQVNDEPTRQEAANAASLEDKWQALARDGETIRAVRLRRETTGEGIREAKDAVEAYLASLPVGSYHAPIHMDEREAIEYLTKYFEEHAPGDDHRRHVKSAMRLLANHTELAWTRFRGVETGPVPPGRHINLAGHHFLYRHGETVVMQWQPQSRSWCPSGLIATLSDVDTKGWRYIAPCPFPLFEDEAAELRGVQDSLQAQSSADNVKLSQEQARALRVFLHLYFPK